MNKGREGRGGGGGGPTNATASVAAQKQKILLQRVDTDIGNLVDNFVYIVNVARVQAADSLLKLVSELKQSAVFSGFASLNDHMDQRIEEFNNLEEFTKDTLSRIGEAAASSLNELESHLLLFYASDEHSISALREDGLAVLAVACFN